MEDDFEPRRARFWEDLRLLRESWRRTGNLDYLNMSVSLLRAVLHEADDDREEEVLLCLDNLAGALAARYGVTARREDLAEVTRLYRVAAERVPPGDPRRADWLSERASRLAELYSAEREEAVLGEVVAAWRAALVAGGPGYSRRAWCRSGLGTALVARYRTSGAIEDLEEATVLLYSALTEMPLSTPDAVNTAAQMADALLARAPHKESADTIDTALEILRGVLVHNHRGTHRAVLLLKMCVVLLAKYHADGALETLDRAIASARQAITIADRDNPVAAHGVLAQALITRHHLTAEPDDCDEAIDLLQRVAGTAGPNHGQVIATLADCLFTRARRTRHTGDVERAVENLRGALTNPGRDRGALLTKLGHAFVLLHERTGGLEPLDSAGAAFTAVLETLPEQHPDHRVAVANIATVLERSHALTGDVAKLEYAVGLYRRGLALCPRGDKQYLKFVDGLGSALRKLYDATGSTADLEECLSLLREAVSAVPANDPAQLPVRISLAQALRAEHLRTGERAVLPEAAEVVVVGARIQAAAVSGRIRAFAVSGHALATLGEWARAAEAFDEAVMLLPRLASRGRTRLDQHHDLGETAGLAALAAACALNTGRPDRALELLELGRGVLLNRRLIPGGGLTPLRRADPDLAREYERLRREFDAPEPYIPRPSRLEHAREAEWAVLLEQIRALPGLTDFLRPAPARQLLARVASETVVLLVPATFRCDALILREQSLEVLTLPELTLEAAVANGHLLQEATVTAHDLSARPKARLRAQQSVREILDWLWRTTVRPVLERLGARPTQTGPWPRLWWCPVGPMALFPLHAAQALGGESALDCVVSSYTPTVDALSRVRDREPADSDHAASCVVAMGSTPGGYGPLPSAAREASVAAGALPSAGIEADRDATRERVLARLKRSTHAHFACHAVADQDDPAMGRLLVHDHEDHPLTVEDVSGLYLEAELAFLSACATTRTPLRLADEALHITGAFQLAGFRHVIGTLWETDDAASLAIVSAFYRPGRPGDSAAHALHAAVRVLRDRYPLTPTLWAAYIHTGA